MLEIEHGYFVTQYIHVTFVYNLDVDFSNSVYSSLHITLKFTKPNSDEGMGYTFECADGFDAPFNRVSWPVITFFETHKQELLEFNIDYNQFLSRFDNAWNNFVEFANIEFKKVVELYNNRTVEPQE